MNAPELPYKYTLKSLFDALPKEKRHNALKLCRSCVISWRFKRDRYAKSDSMHEMRAIDALVYCEVLAVELSALFPETAIKKTDNH